MHGTRGQVAIDRGRRMLSIVSILRSQSGFERAPRFCRVFIGVESPGKIGGSDWLRNEERVANWLHRGRETGCDQLTANPISLNNLSRSSWLGLK